MIVELLLYFLLIAGGLALAVWLYIVRQGDAEFEFLVNQRTNFVMREMTQNTAVFSCNIPFVNKGTQDGTIMDAYPRHLLPCEQYDGVEVSSLLMLDTCPRIDGYFEALIVPMTTGGMVLLVVKFTAKNGDIKQALAEMPDMSIDIVYQIVARSDWYITKNRMVMTSEEITKALNTGVSR